jgi:hypothetical protein
MTTTVLPNPKDVRDMFEGLLGREVTVAPSGPPDADKPLSVGLFVDDSLGLAAVGVADVDLTAYAGAAIGLVPPGGAQAAIEDRELPQALNDNFSEVLNIISALFNLPGHPHLKLYGTYAPGQTPPNDVVAMIRTIGRRLDLEIGVAGYGQGLFSLILA